MRALATILVVLISTQAFANDISGWKVESVKTQFEKFPFYADPVPVATSIQFKNKNVFTTNIIDIKVIDVVISNKGIPFIIFSGVDCYDCHVNRAIYIHSPTNGFLDGNAGKNRYSHPGRLYYYIDNSLLREERLFYGNCLTENYKNVVWFTNYLGKDDKWHKQVYAVKFIGNKEQKVTINLKYSSINKILELVKKEKCKEIPGFEMTSEP